jgi:hypothetical protein
LFGWQVAVAVDDGNENIAFSFVLVFIVSVQRPVPLQPPPSQPVNVEPAAAWAVRVTLVPTTNDAEQVGPHEIPAGSEVTEPLPIPPRLTNNLTVTGSSAEARLTPSDIAVDKTTTISNATLKRALESRVTARLHLAV